MDERQRLGAQSVLREKGRHRGMERQGGKEAFQGSTMPLERPKLMVESSTG